MKQKVYMRGKLPSHFNVDICEKLCGNLHMIFLQLLQMIYVDATPCLSSREFTGGNMKVQGP